MIGAISVNATMNATMMTLINNKGKVIKMKISSNIEEEKMIFAMSEINKNYTDEEKAIEEENKKLIDKKNSFLQIKDGYL